MVEGKSLAKAAAGIMAITLLSKIMGLGREIVIASQLGATSAGDAFKVAAFLPLMLFAFMSAALTNTFIPLLAEQESTAGKEAVDRFVGNVTNVVTILMVTLTLLGMIINPWLVRLVAPGFDRETSGLTVRLTYFLMPVMILLGFNGLTTGYLNYRHVFVLPRIDGIVFNLLTITTLLVMVPQIGVYGAVAGLCIAYTGQFAFRFIVAWRCGYRFRRLLNWRDPYLIRMFRLAAPMIIGTSVGMLATLVDRIFASSLASGSISALDYAFRLNDFAITLFVSAIGSVYFPTLARAGAARDWACFRQHLERVLSVVIYIILPVTAGLMVLVNPLVSLLFERGAFDARAAVMTATALFYYSIGLIGFALQGILTQAFCAVQDTVTPVINGALMVLINVVINFWLVRVIGLGGIALATSIAANLMLFYLASRLQSKIPGLGYKHIRRILIKGGLAVLLMAMAVKGCDLLLARVLTGKTGLLVRAAVGIGSGFLVYFSALVYFKVPEIQLLLNFIGDKTGLFRKRPHGAAAPQKPVTVLHVGYGGIGGAARVVLDIARSHDLTCFKPVVALLGYEIEAKYSQELEDCGIPVVTALKRKKWDLAFFFSLRKIMSEYRPAVVVLHTPVAYFWGRLACLGLKTKLVVSVEHSTNSGYGRFGRIINMIQSHLVSDRVVCVSEDVKKIVKKELRLPDKKLRVINNGIPPDRYPGVNPETLFGGRPVRIKMVSRLEGQKDPATLINAVKMLQAQEADVKLDFVGDGALRPVMEQLAAKLGVSARVTFLGTRADVPALLRDTDIFVLSTHLEGLPISLLEAMAVGLPCIATAVPGNLGVIEDRISGLLVPPEDAAALCAAIASLIIAPDKAKRLAAAARARVLVKYSISRTVREYERLFTEGLS